MSHEFDSFGYAIWPRPLRTYWQLFTYLISFIKSFVIRNVVILHLSDEELAMLLHWIVLTEYYYMLLHCSIVTSERSAHWMDVIDAVRTIQFAAFWIKYYNDKLNFTQFRPWLQWGPNNFETEVELLREAHQASN